ncbi:MAG: DUF2147 domain-containing protein [Bacteroidia bacterium]|nr:DUF2147 domain-containing protein [Bacteroidia bacterium]
MKKLTLFSFIIFTVSVFSQTPSVAEGDKILGTWLTGSGNAHIKITKYGESKYGGKIVWLKDPKRADGTIKNDDKNPDKAKQANTIMGLNNLLGFTYSGNKSYEGGSIYDPENGKTYKCVMTLDDDNTLKVRGYVGIQMLGRTDLWKRVTE